jgi:RNA polymerase sigma factor (TIGR02999 family)
MIEDRKTLDELFSLAYAELRRLASSVRVGDPGQTLNPTALVHEAWIKLAGSAPVAAASPLHFKRIAARAMRQVLVDAARRRGAAKRGGGAALVTFDEGLQGGPSTADDVLALDRALEALKEVSPRQAQGVEARFFGGLQASEIAAMQEISEATVLRDWRAARAWLARRIREED